MSFNVPEGWEIVKLGQVLNKLQYGYTASASERFTEIKLLRITDIQNKIVNWETVPGCEISNDEYERYKLENGDFVFARTGSIEKAWLVVNVPKAVFASYLIRGKPLISDISPWLNKFIETLDYLRQIGAAGAGIGRKNVNAQNLSKITIPLPPLNEQKRIVTKIEALQQRSNRAKTELEAIKPLLDQFRQSVLSAAFRGDLTRDWREKNPHIEPAFQVILGLKTPEPETFLDIFEQSVNYKLPSSWEWIKLGQLGLMLGGGTPSKSNPEFWNGDIPWVSPKDMKQDRIKDSTDHISQKAIINSSVKIIPKKSILFVVRGMILNHTLPVAITDLDVTINQDMKAIVPELSEMSEYLLFATKFVAPKILFKVKSATHGTRRLETPILKNWAIPLPPISEQLEIVRRIENLFKLADSIEKQHQQAQTQLETLNQSILAKAFRGELVPQNPNDEPASVLLERIKAEKAKQEKQKKTAKKTSKNQPKQH